MDFKIERSFLDRAIGILSPRWEFDRLKARASTEFLMRSFDGASKGRGTKNWSTTSASAQAEISPALSTLRNRSRDLVRNEPYANKGVSAIVSNVVGTGIVLKVNKPKVRKLWESWANCRDCDYIEQLNFYAIQSLVMRTLVESGEVLIIKRREADRKNPLRLQVLEPDFIDTMQYGDDIIDGIKYDRTTGKVLGYYLFEQHPGDSYYQTQNSLRSRYKSNFVPASEVIHLFRVDRPGQHRGVPWLAPAMIALRDLGDYARAQIVRQKIAACFVGFMYDTEASLTQPTDSAGNTIQLTDKFEPGSWQKLPPGKDIKFGMPPTVGNDFSPYMKLGYQGVAASLGISYETLTGDLSQVNFSSGRMGWIEMHRNIESWRWALFIPGFCERVFEWWEEAQFIAGNINSDKNELIWTAPRREMIDPVKEGQAMKDAIRSGLTSLSDSLRQLGYDPEQHLKEMAEDNKRLDDLKLTLDSDPRRDVNSNLAAKNEEEDSTSEDSEEEEEKNAKNGNQKDANSEE